MTRLSKFFLLFAAFAVLFTTSCGICAKLPREEIRYVLKDSTVTVFRDSILFIPVERVVDVVQPYDTLKMETSLASSTAYVDTATHTLKGTLENKKGAEFKYKEKIIYREHRDTLWREKEIPVEVEKEVKVHYWYEKYLWFISILALAYLGFKFYKFIMKFSGVDIGSLLKKK